VRRPILFVGILFAIFLILLLMAKQSNISKLSYPTIRARLLALGERLTSPKQQTSQLEKPQQSASESPVESDKDTSPIEKPNKQIQKARDAIEIIEKTLRSTSESLAEPDKNALRIKRVNKLIQEARDAIELIKTRIENLPWPAEPKDKLKVINEKRRLLFDQERNYLKIIQLAERNPDLGIDVLAVKKELIKCQGDQKKAELEKQHLRKIIQGHKQETGLEEKHHQIIIP
jgi:hypothetical protein